ncbi:hypothetical protein CHU98_g862 [Xylaria longipes]|nr:hypothetical protein CHU98_g862 [Xylaria longipes]
MTIAPNIAMVLGVDGDNDRNCNRGDIPPGRNMRVVCVQQCLPKQEAFCGRLTGIQLYGFADGDDRTAATSRATDQVSAARCTAASSRPRRPALSPDRPRPYSGTSTPSCRVLGFEYKDRDHYERIGVGRFFGDEVDVIYAVADS